MEREGMINVNWDERWKDEEGRELRLEIEKKFRGK